jgi:hypothetical protein
MEILNRVLAIPFVSVLAGAGITWLAAWWYYTKAGKELREESQKLRRTSDLIVYYLANPGADLTPKYDEAGHVVGLYLNVAAKLSGAGEMNANAETEDKGPQ